MLVTKLSLISFTKAKSLLNLIFFVQSTMYFSLLLSKIKSVIICHDMSQRKQRGVKSGHPTIVSDFPPNLSDFPPKSELLMRSLQIPLKCHVKT